jgi:hypothetical protein
MEVPSMMEPKMSGSSSAKNEACLRSVVEDVTKSVAAKDNSINSVKNRKII